jgi:hypothetical protein
MKKRGRPDLPWEYWDDLARFGGIRGNWNVGKLVKLSRKKGQLHKTLFCRPRAYELGLSAACKLILEKGPLRWVRDGSTITKISNPKTFRVRIMESRQHLLDFGEKPPMTTELWQGDKRLRDKKRVREAGDDWEWRWRRRIVGT